MFSEVKQQGMKHAKLYNRKRSADKLVSTLLPQTGVRETPFMDNCFGAGKTVLAAQFRELVDVWPLNPTGFEALKSAVYLHVPCLDIAAPIPVESVHDPGVYDRHALTLFARVLELSAKRPLPLDISSTHGFVVSLLGCAGIYRFIFHVDDIGIYEKYGETIAKNMIYRIWHLGDALKTAGYFFIMSGRSRLLRTVGQETKETGEFSSPNLAIHIPLPLLTDASVERMLDDAHVLDRVMKEDNLQYVARLCSGVPRAIDAAVHYLVRVSSTDRAALDDGVCSFCLQEVLISSGDRDLYTKCLEISWASFFLPLSASLCGQPLSALVARLGIFVKYHPTFDNLVILVVPLYMVRYLNLSVRSAKSIAEGSDVGSRLENAFRRILHLRYLVDPKNWTEAGLPYLDEVNVTFPSVKFQNTYPFPKITKKSPATNKEIETFMSSVHSGKSEHTRVEFPLSAMPYLCELMQFGQFYQSLPKSGSADGKIRAAKTEMVDFQFKNFVKPFAAAHVTAEVPKSALPGWTVHLVIVCCAGHEENGGKDTSYMVDGIHCVLLSKESVEVFFGRRALEAIAGKPLLADTAARLFSSPVRTESMKTKESEAVTKGHET